LPADQYVEILSPGKPWLKTDLGKSARIKDVFLMGGDFGFGIDLTVGTAQGEKLYQINPNDKYCAD